MSPLTIRAQLIVGATVIVSIAASMWAYSARQTHLEQLRVLGSQMPVVARTLADALEPDTDPPGTITRVLASLQVTPDSAAIITRGDGVVLGTAGPAAATAGRHPMTMPRLETTTDADGVERVWGVGHREDGAVYVAIARPTRLAWERTLPIYRRNLRTALLATVLTILTLAVTFGLASRGLRRLEEMAQRVSRGDLTVPSPQPMPSKELDHLQATFIGMIGKVRELQQQVVRQERLAAIGVLVSGVAHEISNPLQAILGSAQVLKARTDLPADTATDLDVIQHESQRAGTIIRNLTRFTRQQPVGPAPVRLSDVVGWLGGLWEKRLREQQVTLEIDDQAAGVALAVASELQQVALNFLVNAEYALRHPARDGARLVLRTRDTPNGFVRLEVEDNGPGVPPDDVSKLFQPFFTSKPVGEGTGLGLSVSYGIIHSYGGCIGYERGPMGGALFYFEVPAAPKDTTS